MDQAPDVIQNRNPEGLQPGFALMSVRNEDAIGVHGASHFIIMLGIAHEVALNHGRSPLVFPPIPECGRKPLGNSRGRGRAK